MAIFNTSDTLSLEQNDRNISYIAYHISYRKLIPKEEKICMSLKVTIILYSLIIISAKYLIKYEGQKVGNCGQG
jgi:hypothetical protein